MELDDFFEESPWGQELAVPEVLVPLDLGLEGDELRAAAAGLVDQQAVLGLVVARRRKKWFHYLVRAWEDARTQHAWDAWAMVYDADGLPAHAILQVHGGEREHPDDADAGDPLAAVKSGGRARRGRWRA